MLGDVVHPGQSLERKIKSRLRWLSRTVNEQQRFLRGKLLQILRPFISDVQLYSRIGGVDHELLGHEFLRWIGRNGGLGRSGLGLCELRSQHGAAEGEGAVAERLTSRDKHDLPPCFGAGCQSKASRRSRQATPASRTLLSQAAISEEDPGPRGIVSGSWEANVVQDEGPLLCRFSDAGMTRLSTHCGDR